MEETIVLGIDCGGTHTDAALLAIGGKKARLLAAAKTPTDHADLPASIAKACQIVRELGGTAWNGISRVTLGTTLCINALLQDRADKVGLALSAGPGLDPAHFGLGNHVCIVPGGLDHRGIEVSPLYTDILAGTAARWRGQGVAAIACVGKFSPRNPAHEDEMARIAKKASGLPVVKGHNLSGMPNFPRRIATAYYNAAVARLHAGFLEAVEMSCGFGEASLRLLKADGGAASFSQARKYPAQSILSGPAASVMGALAQWPHGANGCSLLLDMGGTTTDIAIVVDGSPVLDRKGMMLLGRRTLVRALAQQSVAVGGDSLIKLKKCENGPKVAAGPEREGQAMAYGGSKPTLLDAFNCLNDSPGCCGDVEASRKGMRELAGDQAIEMAESAVRNAMESIVKAAYSLVENVNESPVYTLAGLRAHTQARPVRGCLVGGPARAAKSWLEKALALPLDIPQKPEIANAMGAALALPAAGLELYADTGTGSLYVPSLDIRESVGKNFTLEDAKIRACEYLASSLAEHGEKDADVEVVEASMFATLDDRGYGSRDMRVAVQARPGLAAAVDADSCA